MPIILRAMRQTTVAKINTDHAPIAELMPHINLPRVVPRIDPTVNPKATIVARALMYLPRSIYRQIIFGKAPTNFQISPGICVKSFRRDCVASPAPTRRAPLRIAYKLKSTETTENRTEIGNVFSRPEFCDAANISE